MPTTHVTARATRDRLIDLLGLGETYPLEDVGVEDTHLTVSFHDNAEFKIDPAEDGVLYELYDESGAVGDEYKLVGTGDAGILQGPPLDNDKTFLIRASKIDFDPLKRWTFLRQTATVKVDINTALSAWIDHLSPMDDLFGADTGPGAVDYGGFIEVVVESSQKEAQYRLVYKDEHGVDVTTDEVSGDGGAIRLPIQEVFEDTIIQIWASRTFDPSEGRDNLNKQLSVVLPLAVRANPNLSASIEGSPIVDPQIAPAVTIAQTQTSARYRAYSRSLFDDDFDFTEPHDPSSILIAVGDGPDVPAHMVAVKQQPWPVDLADGFALHEADLPGSGADLSLPLGALAADSYIVIQAYKVHSVPGVDRVGETRVQLTQPLVALPRPDPAPDLGVIMTPGEDPDSGTLLVTGGQRGVFYYFRLSAGTDPIGLPAYFHRLSEYDETQTINLGIGNLRIERDFVVAREGPPGQPPPLVNLDTLPPLPPLVEISPLPDDGSLVISAVWARTGVAWASFRSWPS